MPLQLSRTNKQNNKINLPRKQARLRAINASTQTQRKNKVFFFFSGGNVPPQLSRTNKQNNKINPPPNRACFRAINESTKTQMANLNPIITKTKKSAFWADFKNELLLYTIGENYFIALSFTVNWLFFLAAAFTCNAPLETALSILLTASL